MVRPAVKDFGGFKGRSWGGNPVLADPEIAVPVELRPFCSRRSFDRSDYTEEGY